jgi:hypothetical protein
LAVRLLAAVESAASDSSSAESPVAAPAEKPSVEKQPAKVERRRLPALFAMIAACALVAVGAYAIWTQFSPYSAQHCVAAAAELEHSLKSHGAWNPKLSTAPANRKPQTRIFGSFRGWQTVSLLGDNGAVAYRFKNKNATLFVCQPDRSIASAFPTAPQRRNRPPPRHRELKSPRGRLQGWCMFSWLPGPLKTIARSSALRGRSLRTNARKVCATDTTVS